MSARVVYTGARTLRVEPQFPVTPGLGMVRVDVAYTGICGTDLHIYHGDMDNRVPWPCVVGHEMSGRIAEAGQDAGGWRAGDPVTVMPLDWCGHCPACGAPARGRPKGCGACRARSGRHGLRHDVRRVRAPRALRPGGVGLVPNQKAGRFLGDGGHPVDGSLPLNPHGGNNSQGRSHGIGHVVQVALQLRGDAGAKQLPGVHATVVNGGALMFSEAMVLHN
jgi:Alcohol dehydrogenase GroES-like domain